MLQRKILSLSNTSLFESETIFSWKIISQRKKLLLWIYVRWPSSHLWFNGRRKSPVAGLNWNPWFKNKNLKKARMYRTWLRNIFLRNKFGEKWIKTNIGIFLPGSPRKAKVVNYGTLNTKILWDKFWGSVKPLCWGKRLAMIKSFWQKNIKNRRRKNCKIAWPTY